MRKGFGLVSCGVGRQGKSPRHLAGTQALPGGPDGRICPLTPSISLSASLCLSYLLRHWLSLSANAALTRNCFTALPKHSHPCTGAHMQCVVGVNAYAHMPVQTHRTAHECDVGLCVSAATCEVCGQTALSSRWMLSLEVL